MIFHILLCNSIIFVVSYKHNTDIIWFGHLMIYSGDTMNEWMHKCPERTNVNRKKNLNLLSIHVIKYYSYIEFIYIYVDMILYIIYYVELTNKANMN